VHRRHVVHKALVLLQNRRSQGTRIYMNGSS
jgi:hypothetical protein